MARPKDYDAHIKREEAALAFNTSRHDAAMGDSKAFFKKRIDGNKAKIAQLKKERDNK